MADIFDQINTDIFDDVELDPKDDVLLSEELGEMIREEIKKIPMGEIISDERGRNEKILAAVKAALTKDISATKEKNKKEIEKLKTEMEDFKGKMREKYSDLRNQMLSAPKYEFGGFPLARDSYTTSNVTPTFTLDPTTSTIDDLYNVVGTIIRTLQGSSLIR